MSARALALFLVGILALPGSAAGTQQRGPSGTIAIPAGPADWRLIYLVSPESGSTQRVLAPEDMLDLDLSPDGRRIAFTSFTGIWIMRRDGSYARRIVKDSRTVQFGAVNVAWSPDGRRLLFLRGASLFTIAADGTHLEFVTSHADAPDWAPDGKHIVFVRNPEQSSRYGVISVIGADGRGLRRVVQNGTWFGPHVSPDGSKVVFFGNGVFVAPASGGRARRLVRNGAAPEWSPDGRHVAFTRDVSCGHAVCSGRVFVAPSSGGRAQAYGPVVLDLGPFSWSR